MNDHCISFPLADYWNAVRSASQERRFAWLALLAAAWPFVAVAWFASRFPVLFAVVAIILVAWTCGQ